MELRLDDEGAHTLFGNRDENLRMLEDEFGVKISSRGNEIHVHGDAGNVGPVERLLDQMQDLIEQGYPLKKSDLSTGVRVLRDRPDTNLIDFFTDDAVQPAIRRVVTPRNVAQKLYLQAMQDFDITISIGPAGTGKTFLAVAAAAAALSEKTIKRIVLCRPAVEAGRRVRSFRTSRGSNSSTSATGMWCGIRWCRKWWSRTTARTRNASKLESWRIRPQGTSRCRRSSERCLDRIRRRQHDAQTQSPVSTQKQDDGCAHLPLRRCLRDRDLDRSGAPAGRARKTYGRDRAPLPHPPRRSPRSRLRPRNRPRRDERAGAAGQGRGRPGVTPSNSSFVFLTSISGPSS